MKNEAFVLVSENRIEFFAENEKSLRMDFCSDDYSNFNEYVSAVIGSFAKGCSNSISCVKLVLPSMYYHFGEQVMPGVRSKKDEKYKIRNFSTPLSTISDADATTYLDVHTEFECDGKSCKKLEDIPLLCKYLKRKTFLYWDSRRLSALVSNLSNFGIEVSSVVPDICLYNSATKNYRGYNAVVSVFDRFSDISIFSNGHVKRTIRFQFGLNDVVRKLSDAFGLSYRNCRKLMELYGFVTVPQQYVHYEISVPVFDDVKKNVKLTDLSYEIREMLRHEFSMLYDEIMDCGVEEVVFKGLPIVDAHILFQMMTSFECNCFDTVSYEKLALLFNVLDTNAYSETIVAEPVAEVKPEPAKEETTEETKKSTRSTARDIAKNLKPAWIDSLMCKINQSKEKINALMVE
ncbi:MAG: cell division FtsA domain-containing protein [Bacteroidales bacterium]|nr:cell division FtsA domain-containing protein [Bacteroidales bacterium]